MAEAETYIGGRLPRIRELHLRHRGVTQALSEGYEEAASVCLAPNNAPPTELSIWEEAQVVCGSLDWQLPTEREVAAWANETDRVEAAGYGVALSAIEHTRSLFAFARARTMSGADYYLAPAGARLQGLEEAFRLEVSGTMSSKGYILNERVRQKLRQVVDETEPSIACIVSFGALKVIIREV